jgi:flagellar hook-associated protein 3 FlgL
MVRTDSVLTALLDLAGALREDDGQGITDAGERVFASISDLIRVQGVVGARAKAMQARQSQTEEAVFTTGKLLSELTDLDYAEAVTRFQQAQAAMQATLIAGSQSLSLSLLDFLG